MAQHCAEVASEGLDGHSTHEIQTARYPRTSSLKAVYQGTPESVLQDRCERCVWECISVQAVLAGHGC